MTQKRKAIFVDRDGTLIKEVNFLSRVEDLEIFDYTPRAIELAKEKDFLIVVVTNQSGIAREIYTEDDMHAIHAEMQTQLSGAIDEFYFCPHLPDFGCTCRKPSTGMIDLAVEKFDIDLSESWMIGDKKLDVELGKNAGVKTALVLTGYGKDHKLQLDFDPDVTAETFFDAIKEIAAR